LYIFQLFLYSQHCFIQFKPIVVSGFSVVALITRKSICTAATVEKTGVLFVGIASICSSLQHQDFAPFIGKSIAIQSLSCLGHLHIYTGLLEFTKLSVEKFLKMVFGWSINLVHMYSWLLYLHG